MLSALLPPGAAQIAPASATVPDPTPPCPPWLVPVRDLQFAHRTGRLRSEPSRRGAVEDSAARSEGKRFERRVCAALLDRFPFLEVEPAIVFRDRFGQRMCYPDILVRFNDRTVVLEVKSRGTQLGDAWWQLERYYRPVVEALYPSDPVFTVAVVRRRDPFVLPRAPGGSLSLDALPAPFSVLDWSALS